MIVLLKVIDDGIGKKQALFSETGIMSYIGANNVHNRLKNIFEPEYDLEIKN